MNTQLIKIVEKGNKQIVSARDLYQGLEIKKRFSSWVTQNFSDFIEGEDFTSVLTGTVVNNGAKRQLQDYAVTIDMAKQLCLLSRTENGKRYRYYLIEVERKYMQQLSMPSYQINDPIKRAKVWISEEQNRQKLVEENKLMQPKALFADAVATSKHSILIGDLAKLIKQNGVDIGANRLFMWLRDKGYLIKRNGSDYNSPTQRSMNAGLFEIKETTIAHADGHVTVSKTSKATGKGQQYFINLFLK